MNDSGYIRTSSGIKFWPLDPRPEHVKIEDIAHALSHACRWAGHVNRHYSVAAHSLHVSAMVGRKYALQALCHDASEAFLCDMPKPVKLGFPEYAAHEERLMRCIATALGFDWPLSAEVHQADAAALYQESKYFFEFHRDIPFTESPRQCNWNFDIVCSATPTQVKQWFLNEYERLRKL